MTSIQKVLTDILDSKDFDELESLIPSSVWSKFSQEEKKLLAQLLVMRGASQLSQGGQQAQESFNMANQISGNAPEILYQQAAALSLYRENIRCLTLALQSLEHALEQAPDLIKGWILRADILIDMALFETDSSSLNQSDDSFKKAFSLLCEQRADSYPKEHFFWRWGVCLASLGRNSGEPIDYYNAIAKYREALALECHDEKFFNAFGNCLAELGALLDKSDYFIEAFLMFNRAVREKPNDFEGWFNQACCIINLAEFNEYSNLLEQAERSFVRAAEIDSKCSLLWLKWGEFEALLGKVKQDPEILEASLLKFKEAYELEPHQHKILSSWGECELCLGVHEQRLDLIHSAQARILKSLRVDSSDPHVWYLYGSSLNELGCYFSEEGYYHQAIEKFQYGLSIARDNSLLWYGLATAHFALAELSEDQICYEKAVKYCARVIECGEEGFPQLWNDWGVALLRLGEMTQDVAYIELAIEKFELALKHPLDKIDAADIDLEWVCNYSCAYNLLGDLKEEPQYFEKAVQIFTQILDFDPDYSVARYNLGIALSHLGNTLYDIEPYHKAIEHFQYLINQDPENEFVHLDLGLSLTNLGLLVHDEHNPEQAKNLFRQAEGHFMQAATLGSMQAYYQLAGLYSITGHYTQAMSYLERARFCGSLPGVEDLLHDEWLEGVRRTHPFRQFIHGLPESQTFEDI